MPLRRWQERIDAGTIAFDAAQRVAAERLDTLARALEAREAGPTRSSGRLLARLVGARGADRPSAPRGLYIHGDVGRGKSMLMDLFFTTVPIAAKRRVHFHEFMLEVQRRLHELRASGEEEPLHAVARKIAAEARLLCFDELHVTNIGDAMILGRLFEGLVEAGVTVVATSNWPPHRLYEGGLNRDRFLPFVDLLLAQVDVIALDGPVDYRLRRLRDVPAWQTPLGPAADARLDAIFAAMTDGAAGAPEAIEVGTRRLPVPCAAAGVAEFVFADLCERPLGAADYLALTARYHTVILRDVPLLTPDRRNEARRFMTLVDALYERRTMLFVSAEASAEGLYASSEGAFEFQRTVSRLLEMQSSVWVEACLGRRPDLLPKEFTPFALTSDLI